MTRISSRASSESGSKHNVPNHLFLLVTLSPIENAVIRRGICFSVSPNSYNIYI